MLEPSKSAAPTFRLLAGGETHRGWHRPDNEDVVVVEPELGLYAVLDGMGGAAAGEVAARLAGEQLVSCLRKNRRLRQRSPEEALRLALDAAAAKVHTAAAKRLEYNGMGTTVVACLVADSSRAVIAHAGDSRVYLFRDGQLAPLTRDHTAAQQLVDDGVVSPTDIQKHVFLRFHHDLTQNLGHNKSAEPDVVEQALRPGDRLLLCSDGLHGVVPESTIQRILGSRNAPDAIARHLVRTVLNGPARDNVSAVVIAVDCHGPDASC